MADRHFLTTLRYKRAELAGLIDASEDQLCKAMNAVDCVDCTLRMFVPEIDLDEIKPKPLPPRHPAFKGQVTRAIVATMRQGWFDDVKAITMRLMAERGLNPNDEAVSKTMKKRIGAVLRNWRNRPLGLSSQGAGGMLLW